MRRSLKEQAQHHITADATPMRQWLSPIVLTVAVGVAYFLAARLSLFLMTQPGVAVFWPAAGVASGTLIALGHTARWPVAIGVIAANIPANLTGDRNILSSTIFSLSDAGEALLVAWMIERYIGQDFSLGRLRHVLGLLAAAILGTAVSGVGGTLGYKLAYNPNDPAMTVWQQWVASDTIGIIAVAPLVIGFVASFRTPPSRRELLEGVMALIAVAATTGLIIFMLPPDWWEMCVAVVLLFPVVLWVAARCPPMFASAAVFIVSLIVITTVTFKLGHFSITAPSMDESIVSAQITILGTGLCAFVLSALFSERRQHEAVLAESEARLQEALAVGAVIAFEWDTSTDLVRRSNNAAQILGYDPQQAVNKASYVARIHPNDLGRIKELWSNLNPNNCTASTSYRFLRFDGREIWLEEISKGEFDATGRLVRVKGLALDITERTLAEKHQKVLMGELDHRVKNILARVAVVAKYTFEGGRSTNELIRALDGRIQSMADAHTLLSQSHWHGASLADLVRGQLAPYTTETNIVIGGPDITLSAAETQAVAMVLQELVTNAVKYGSLSTPDGRVSVNWDRRDSVDGLSRVVIAWRETGGPSTKAPSQSGYGTNLIRNLIPHELGGIVNLVFAPDGLNCDIEIPLKKASSSAGIVRHSLPDARMGTKTGSLISRT
jgi:PAS domain S-box-containing protein